VGLATVFNPFGEVKKIKKSNRLWMAIVVIEKGSLRYSTSSNTGDLPWL